MASSKTNNAVIKALADLDNAALEVALQQFTEKESVILKAAVIIYRARCSSMEFAEYA